MWDGKKALSFVLLFLRFYCRLQNQLLPPSNIIKIFYIWSILQKIYFFESQKRSEMKAESLRTFQRKYLWACGKNLSKDILTKRWKNCKQNRKLVESISHLTTNLLPHLLLFCPTTSTLIQISLTHFISCFSAVLGWGWRLALHNAAAQRVKVMSRDWQRRAVLLCEKTSISLTEGGNQSAQNSWAFLRFGGKKIRLSSFWKARTRTIIKSLESARGQVSLRESPLDVGRVSDHPLSDCVMEGKAPLF